jgi:hypothetical protein
MYRLVSLLLAAMLAAKVGLVCSAPVEQPSGSRISFNRDIRPILSDNCFQCHGPDRNQRKAKLRLDTGEGAFEERSNHRVLTPGKPDASELFRRITSADPAEQMPPPKKGRLLSASDRELIRTWIEQGATWEKHWAYLPPAPQFPPALSAYGARWARNPIDSFILDRLQREGLTPSPEADRTTLLRRVTLDLTGLPPTPAEVEAFLADESPDAYERIVDRLLASPRFGERMARPWLDAARYADTNGYQTDGERFMWRWRDWVINAFNCNLPYDQFTIEQLAGDMLPHATLDQRVATGFNRNHRGNGEGGIIPEEYAVEYVVDRVETTATVWLGLTVGCARCHDHKFDPITQKEFYQLFAYFNHVPEKGKAIKYGNSPPLIKAPTRDQLAQLNTLDGQLAAAERQFAALQPDLRRAQAEWEQKFKPDAALDWTIDRALVVHHALDADGPANAKLVDGASTFLPGRLGWAAHFDGRRYIDAGDVAKFDFYDKFTLSAWIQPEGNGGGTIISRMTDKPEADGYYLALKAGKLQLNLVKRWLDDALRVESEIVIPADQWSHVAVTYDGTRVADGVKLYVNGQPAKLHVVLDELNQSFDSKEPLRIGGGGGLDGRFHGLIDEVRVYGDVLDAGEAQVLAAADTLSAIAALPASKRTTLQSAKLHAYFRERAAPAAIHDAWRQLVRLRAERQRFFENIPTTMVMAELPTPRPAHVLIRGAYDKPGERVSCGVPNVFGPSKVPADRLEFARWLAHSSNPLTARVTVNRFWQLYFGAGLVKTTEDFGVQGAWPTHPELLDWLALQFAPAPVPPSERGEHRGWDVKHLQRLIVTSATYRQASRLTPALLQKDPENRLLARAPRLRLPAEMVRDQALATSGLLVERLGGPSVKPYQPPGLWKELTGMEDYVQDAGDKLYRRSLYTFWKRTVPPPVMVNFDAAGRETCIVRETRTNTPLQALNLMNDVSYVEAARVLAQRIIRGAGPTPEERVSLAFRLVTARPPKPAELRILIDAFQAHLAEYRKDRAAAVKLTSAGESPRDERLDAAEWAAYTAVVQVILNLDEVVVRE